MAWKGKILGGAFGFFVGGPVGAILGSTLGHQLDKATGNIGIESFANLNEKNSIQTAFFNATFLVMGHVAKSDGVVSPAEIQLAEQVMQHLQLSTEKRKQAIQLFNQGKQEDFSLTQSLNEFKQHCQHRQNLLYMFLEIQIQIALADGEIHPEEEVVLLQICQQLAISDRKYQRIKRRLIALLRFQQYKQQSLQNTSKKGNLSEAYAVLGLKASATESEIKQAYRKLISQHHPDKLVAKGLPEEMMTLAKEKTQQIRKAYETIKEHRKDV